MTPLRLIWEKKENGEKIPLLPLKTIEKFDTPRVQFKTFKDPLKEGKLREESFNKLILGDNLYIMNSLLPQFKGKIKLIYIDPPFATGSDFSFKVQVKSFRHKEQEGSEIQIDEWAYKDDWSKNFTEFLTFIRNRLIIMKELLANDGSIYVHLDYHSSHYVKILMDEIFGREQFQREITWNTAALNVAGFKGQANNWIRASDTILFYSKSEDFTFNKQFIPYDFEYIAKTFKLIDEDGRRYKVTRRKNKVFLEDEPGEPVTTVWNDILSFNYVAPANLEGEGYPTQKPEALLARIIKASSNEGDLVADFFCGSGTMAVVAEKLNRRWICTDLGVYGIRITTKRLLGINKLKAYDLEDYHNNFRPFIIQTLEGYAQSKFSDLLKQKEDIENIDSYIHSLLIKQLKLSTDDIRVPFHGKKGDSLYYIQSFDEMLTINHIQRLIEKRKKFNLDFNKIRILVWETPDDLYKELKAKEKENNLTIKVFKLPMSAIENLENPNISIKLYDIYACKIGLKVDKDHNVLIKLLDFNIEDNEYINASLKKKAEKARSKYKNIKKFTYYIDYWSIDSNYDGKVFNPDWYSFKSRKNEMIEDKYVIEYPSPGIYTILIKIYDLFGNEYVRKSKISIN
ncbi:MAG: site-specific DNA-methyltransferase [Promethearchaeota archaeon]